MIGGRQPGEGEQVDTGLHVHLDLFFKATRKAEL
jgi:hypothetical protein